MTNRKKTADKYVTELIELITKIKRNINNSSDENFKEAKIILEKLTEDGIKAKDAHDMINKALFSNSTLRKYLEKRNHKNKFRLVSLSEIKCLSDDAIMYLMNLKENKSISGEELEAILLEFSSFDSSVKLGPEEINEILEEKGIILADKIIN